MGVTKALCPGRAMTSAQVWALLPGKVQVLTWNLIIKTHFLRSQLRVVSFSSAVWTLTVSGFSGDVEVPTLPTGAGHVSRSTQGSQFALSIPSPLSSCDMFRCLMPLCRDAAQGFVHPNYLLFNFCVLLKVLPVPGKMSS